MRKVHLFQTIAAAGASSERRGALATLRALTEMRHAVKLCRHDIVAHEDRIREAHDVLAKWTILHLSFADENSLLLALRFAGHNSSQTMNNIPAPTVAAASCWTSTTA